MSWIGDVVWWRNAVVSVVRAGSCKDGDGANDSTSDRDLSLSLLFSVSARQDLMIITTELCLNSRCRKRAVYN
jgi:hypothetical protein